MKLELADNGAKGSNVVWVYNPQTGIATAVPQTLSGPGRKVRKAIKEEKRTRKLIKQQGKTAIVRTKQGNKLVKVQAKGMKPQARLIKRQTRLQNWVDQQQQQSMNPTYNAAGTESNTPIPDVWGNEYMVEQQMDYATDPSVSMYEAVQDVDFDEVPDYEILEDGLGFGIPGFGIVSNLVTAPVAGAKALFNQVTGRGGRDATQMMPSTAQLVERIKALEVELQNQKQATADAKLYYGGGGAAAGFIIGKFLFK